MPVPRKVFHPKRGWYNPDEIEAKEDFHFVHDDTMAPIENHMNGKTYDSKSAYIKSVEGHETPDGKRYRIMGNDFKGEMKLPERKKISTEQMRDAKEYALSVANDPAKLRAWRNEENDRRAEYDKCGLGE